MSTAPVTEAETISCEPSNFFPGCNATQSCFRKALISQKKWQFVASVGRLGNPSRDIIITKLPGHRDNQGFKSFGGHFFSN